VSSLHTCRPFDEPLLAWLATSLVAGYTGLVRQD
jgi:hypothetical protein